MKTLILCYSPADAAPARSLGEYLAANLPYHVSYEEGQVREGFDLVDATERALSAEAALVLLSPNSIPKAWNREKWEPVFFQGPAEFGTQLGFVMLEPCKFPELLRRLRFFEASQGDLPSAARRIRRWLLRPDQPVEEIVLQELIPQVDSVLDRAGSLADVRHALALDFAANSEPDFEAVIRLNCEGRSEAGILGDLGCLAGLRLPGTAKENHAHLAEWAAVHRCLLVVENAEAEHRSLLSLGGLVSVLFTADSPERQWACLEELGAAFLAVPREELQCAALVGDAARQVAELLPVDFEVAQRLGWSLVGFLKETSRFAEAVEILDFMEAHARQRNDALALYKITWEQSWLREVSPENEIIHILPTAGEQVAQLSLF